MYDFVVVGAGPAGSRFARKAAEAGHDVVVFEKGIIGEPLACSGHVSTDIWSFTPEGARAQLLQNEIFGARFHSGGPDSDAYPFYKESVVSNVIDRIELDRTLARAAQSAGATINEHHTVTAVTETADCVEVTVQSECGIETVEGNIVVGCDGPVSRVRRDLDLPEPDEKLVGLLGFEADPDHQDFVDVYLSVPTFFAWRIPRGDRGVEWGLAAPPGEDAKARFDDLLADAGVSVNELCSGPIPIGPPETVTSDRALLIGDAAAQNKPFTGGGILYGMTAADIAADVVDPADPTTIETYEQRWRAKLGREIALGAQIRRGYSFPKPLQRAGMRIFSGEIGVHMDRPTSLFSKEQLRSLLPGRLS